MCCERWSNEAATVHADIWPDQPDVPAVITTYFLMGPLLLEQIAGLCIGFELCRHALAFAFELWLRRFEVGGCAGFE